MTKFGRLAAQSQTAKLLWSTVVARQLPLHPTAAMQLRAALLEKGTLVPFSHSKGTGRAVYLPLHW